jgi:lipopolysaccharide exporter
MQLGYTAVISRLVAPAAFGAMAAALLGMRFITYLSRMGLGSALVQKASLSPRDTSTAFALALALGSVMSLLTVAVSPLLAALVKNPDAAPVTAVMAITVFTGAVAAIPEAIARRALRFRALGIAQVASFFFGYLVIGLSLARLGWGVWSLVWANVAQSTCLLVVLIVIARPPLPRGLSRESATHFLRFGGAVSLTGFFEFLTGSLDTLATGRYLGPALLGQYSRATLLVGLPIEQATAATTRVLLPSLSSVQHEQNRYVRAVTMASGLLAAVVIIPVVLMSSAAPALVPLVLGSGWDDAAAVLPLVGCAQAVNLLTHLPAVAAEAKGAVGAKLAVQTVSLISTAVFIGAVAVWWPGLLAFAAAWLAGQVVRAVLYWIHIFPRIGLSRAAVGRRYAEAAVGAVVVSAPMFLVVRVWGDLGVVPLLAASTAGIVAAIPLLARPGSLLRGDGTRVWRQVRER